MDTATTVLEMAASCRAGGSAVGTDTGPTWAESTLAQVVAGQAPPPDGVVRNLVRGPPAQRPITVAHELVGELRRRATRERGNRPSSSDC